MLSEFILLLYFVKLFKTYEIDVYAFYGIYYVYYGYWKIDDSDVVQTLSPRLYDGDVVYEHRSCRSKSHRKCQKGISKRCKRCWTKCWLI